MLEYNPEQIYNKLQSIPAFSTAALILKEIAGLEPSGSKDVMLGECFATIAVELARQGEQDLSHALISLAESAIEPLLETWSELDELETTYARMLSAAILLDDNTKIDSILDAAAGWSKQLQSLTSEQSNIGEVFFHSAALLYGKGQYPQFNRILDECTGKEGRQKVVKCLLNRQTEKSHPQGVAQLINVGDSLHNLNKESSIDHEIETSANRDRFLQSLISVKARAGLLDDTKKYLLQIEIPEHYSGSPFGKYVSGCIRKGDMNRASQAVEAFRNMARQLSEDHSSSQCGKFIEAMLEERQGNFTYAEQIYRLISREHKEAEMDLFLAAEALRGNQLAEFEKHLALAFNTASTIQPTESELKNLLYVGATATVNRPSNIFSHGIVVAIKVLSSSEHRQLFIDRIQTEFSKYKYLAIDADYLSTMVVQLCSINSVDFALEVAKSIPDDNVEKIEALSYVAATLGRNARHREAEEVLDFAFSQLDTTLIEYDVVSEMRDDAKRKMLERLGKTLNKDSEQKKVRNYTARYKLLTALAAGAQEAQLYDRAHEYTNIAISVAIEHLSAKLLRDTVKNKLFSLSGKLAEDEIDEAMS